MASSFNGFGTSFVTASRPRAVRRSGEYDAVEGIAFFFCLLIPYRAVYVLSLWMDTPEQDQLHCVPLRFAPRIILKAYLRSWGNALLLYLGGLTICFAVALVAEKRAPLRPEYQVLFVALFTLVVIGAIFRIVWSVLDTADNRIRDAIGDYEFGHASPDPYYWPDEVADSVRGKLLDQEVLPSLVALAQLALLDRNRSKAVAYLRLAMRYESEADSAKELLDEVLSSTR